MPSLILIENDQIGNKDNQIENTAQRHICNYGENPRDLESIILINQSLVAHLSIIRNIS